MASFAALDKRMMRDVKRIHDFLWDSGWKGDGARLLEDLTAEARELDAFLRAGGKLRRHAERLARATATDKESHGGALFELLYDAYNLTAATEHVRRKDFRGAGEHATWVVESGSIGTCVALDAFPLVEEWEAGTIDFETYAGRLADLLEGKGIADPGQYKRMMLATHTFGKEWDGSVSREQQALAARAAVAGAGWCILATRSMRQAATGKTPPVPSRDYAAIVDRILARL